MIIFLRTFGISLLGLFLFFASLGWAFYTGSISMMNWGLVATSTVLVIVGFITTGTRSALKDSFASVLYSFFVFVSVVSAYMIITNRDVSWDLTQQGLHTLAPQSVETVKTITTPVELIGFYPVSQHTEMADFFELYANESPFFTYSIFDPSIDLQVAQSLGKNVLTNDVFLRSEKNGKPVLARSVIGYDADRKEQQLTNALLQVEYGSEQRIYFSRGKGERSPFSDTKNQQTITVLGNELESQNLPIVEANFQSMPSIPEDAATVVIFTPALDLLEGEKAILIDYLKEGGSLFVAIDPNFERDVMENLEEILALVGISTENSILIDPQAASQAPGVTFSSMTKDHLITLNSPALVFRHYLARPLTVAPDLSSFSPKVSPLLVSHDQVWRENARYLKRVQRSSRPTDATEIGARFLGLASSFPTPGGVRGKEARVVVFGDGDFLCDEFITNEALTLGIFSMSWLAQRENQLFIPPASLPPSSFNLTQQKLYMIASLLTLISLLLLIGGLSFTSYRRRQG
ncbi:MAG: Gldg family protein [Sumerlaeia bacterium]